MRCKSRCLLRFIPYQRYTYALPNMEMKPDENGMGSRIAKAMATLFCVRSHALTMASAAYTRLFCEACPHHNGITTLMLPTPHQTATPHTITPLGCR